MEPIPSNCILCDRPDAVDNLVQCDKCDAYVHYSCAGVNESISHPDRSFICRKCIDASEFATVPSMRSSRSSRSSRKSAQLALNLQLLEEEKQLRLKKIYDEEKFRRQRLEEEERSIKQRYALLQANLIAQHDGSSRKSGVSSRVVRENTKNWVGTGGQTEGANIQVAAASARDLPVSSRAINAEADFQQQGGNKFHASYPEQRGYRAYSQVEQSNSLPAGPQFRRFSSGTNRCHVNNGSFAQNVPNTSTPKNAPIIPSMASKVLCKQNQHQAMFDFLAPGKPPGSVPLLADLPSLPIALPILPPSEAKPPKLLPPVIGALAPELTPGAVPPPVDLCSRAAALTLAPSAGTKQPHFSRPTIASLGSVSSSGSVPWFTDSRRVPYTLPSVPPPDPGWSFGSICDSIVPRNRYESEQQPTMSYPPATAAPVQIHEPVLNPVGPTAVQIASRQVITRDLPTFSGDPQDWPLFYSSFRNSTEACGYNDAENLSRLQRCLRGHALDAVRCRLLIPESVPYVIATLQRLYGRPEVLINTLLNQLRNVPSPKPDDLRTLIKFGMAVQNLVEHMILAEQQHHLANPMLLYEMVEKLPSNLKLKWAYHKKELQNVNLSTFGEFMAELVSMASEVTLHVDVGQSIVRAEKSKREKQSKEQLFVHHTDVVQVQGDQEAQAEKTNLTFNDKVKPCSFCDSCEHRIAECIIFKQLSIDERWRAVRNKGLCRMCLVPHRSWPCRSKRECSFQNCRLRHNFLLHSPTEKRNDNSEISAPSPTSSGDTSNFVQQHHHFVSPHTLLRYLPVTLYGNGKEIHVFAFLDDGSTATMLEAEVADFLGITGPKEPLYLCWTGDVKRVGENSQRIQLKISGAGLMNTFSLTNVRTVQQHKLPSQTFNYEEHCKVYPHLKGLPLRSYNDATPKLIIGLDNLKLMITLKTREGGDDALVAAKTRLGWCSYGRCSGVPNTVEHVNVHTNHHIGNAELHDMMKHFLT